MRAVLFGQSERWLQDRIRNARADEIRKEARFFTRKGKIGIANVLCQILGSCRDSMESEVLNLARCGNMPVVSSAAMFKARAKIRPRFLWRLFRDSADAFGNRNRLRLDGFRGYRLLAVDGSKISVRNDCESAERFAASYTATGTLSRMYEISVLFDVVNHYMLDVSVSRGCDEHAMAKSHVRWYSRHGKVPTIFVFDRGYPDFRLMTLIQRSGFFYVIRLDTSSLRGEQSLLGAEDGDITTERIWTRANTNGYRNEGRLRYYLMTHPTRMRLVRFRVGDTIETLVTNIGSDRMDADGLREIYRLRWEIEVAFKHAKERNFLDRMTGRKIHSMRTDLWSSLLVANLTLMSLWEAERDGEERIRQRLKKSRVRRPGTADRIVGYRISYASASRIFRAENLILGLVTGMDISDKILSQTLGYLFAHLEPLRPGRHFLRTLKCDPVGYTPRR